MIPVTVRAARDLLYLSLGLLTSILAFAVWVAALSLSLSLALFVVGLPVMFASALAFRLTADLDRRNAALVLGRPLRRRYRPQPSSRFLARLATILRDPQTWRDLSWLIVHSVFGFAFGVAAISLAASVVGVAVLPAWYWSIPDGVQFGLWSVDTLWEAFATALLAVPLAAVTAGLLRVMALGHAYLAAVLLGDVPAPRASGAAHVAV